MTVLWGGYRGPGTNHVTNKCRWKCGENRNVGFRSGVNFAPQNTKLSKKCVFRMANNSGDGGTTPFGKMPRSLAGEERGRKAAEKNPYCSGGIIYHFLSRIRRRIIIDGLDGPPPSAGNCLTIDLSFLSWPPAPRHRKNQPLFATIAFAYEGMLKLGSVGETLLDICFKNHQDVIMNNQYSEV